MDSHLCNSWNENLEEILFSLDKKVFFILIIFQAILCIGLQIFFLIANENNIFSKFELIQIFILIVLVFFYFKGKDNRYRDFYFSINVLGFDFISLILTVKYSNENSNYIRMVYQFICFNLITMNIKIKMKKKIFLFLIVIKIILLTLIFKNYNFNDSKIIIILDLFIIISSFAMIFVNRIIKSIFLEYLVKMKDKNFYLEKKLNNIFNSIKYPVISIDLKRKEIYFNSSFLNFMSDNFRNELFGTNHLFSSDINYSNLFSNECNYSKIYLNLIRNLKSDEKSFLDHMIDNDETDKKKCQAFIVKILIFQKILDNFLLKSQFTPSSLNLFKIFKEKNSFPTENCFIKKGEYRIDCGFSDKIIEISWKKTLYNDNQEVLDFLFNDITSLKNPQLNDNNFSKKSTAIMTQILEIPLNSINFYTKKLASKLETIKSDQNILDIDQIHNDIYIIEGLEMYVTCLINNLEEQNKPDLDLEIKLELIELREIIEDVFHIFKSLKSSNLNKRNVNLLINVDKNLPKLIKSDSKRIKQLLFNLLSNYFKFTNSENIKLNVKYEKTTTKTSYDKIIFSFEDTGVGFKKEFLTKLSENFKGNSVKRELTFCNKIVCKLGDSIEFISPNKLKTLNFTLYNFCDYNKLDSSKDNSKYLISTISDEHDNSMCNTLRILDEERNIIKKRNKKLEIIKEHPNTKEEETQRIISDNLSKNNNLSLINISQKSDEVI